MNNLLSLTRAAKLVGVTRAALQKKIQCGEMDSYDGMVSIESLLTCYPDAQLEDNVEYKRISMIKEKAFGKRIYERALPDAEVLAARVTDLGKTLANSQSQLKKLSVLLSDLWGKLDEIGQQGDARKTVDNLKIWIKREVASAMEPGFSNPLSVRDSMLRVMAAQVTVLPSGHDFLLEGQDTILEAAMRAGVPLNYGCSGGNCGLCKAKVLSGQVKKRDIMISLFLRRTGRRAMFYCAVIPR